MNSDHTPIAAWYWEYVKTQAPPNARPVSALETPRLKPLAGG